MLEGLALLPCIPKPPSIHPLSVSLTLSRSIRCSSSSPSISTGSPYGAAADLSARERRQLKNERREKNAEVGGNWREQVEDILSRRRKKEYSNWKEKLNLDNLANLGPRWWMVRVSRVNGQETADRLSRALSRGFPGMDFKVYFPAVRERRMLKSGSYSDKMKSLYPGCVFLQCVLNKEVHDFIGEVNGIGGFLGAKVGNTKRQINKPKPVVAEDMERIFQEAKEQQQNFDKAFEKEQRCNHVDSRYANSKKVADAEDQSGKNLERPGNITLSREETGKLAAGATVRVLTGPFAEFTGRLKGLDRKSKKATVGFTLFGKESSVDLEVEQIVAETL